MKPKMFRQPRVRCLKIFLFLTGSSIILLWNYYNPQGLSGLPSQEHLPSEPHVGAIVDPAPKRLQFSPAPGEPVPKVHAKPVNKAPVPDKDNSPPKKNVKEEKKQQKGLIPRNGAFYLDGNPMTILSGSFHYFRTHPQQWSDRLAKMRAAGLNTVTTYIPWNLHEPQKGKYEFAGLFNIAEFIKTVKQHNLLMIIRPGPYICAEWEFGGFPYWLLRDSKMKFRTSTYKPYLDAVENYFSKLLPLFVPFMYQNGGPVVAFQIENEFGSWGSDPAYMTFLHKLFIKHGLNKELLMTSDGQPFIKKGKIDGVLTTVNFNGNPEKKLMALKELQPKMPLMVMEFWPGWFDRWKEKHHAMPTEELKEKITTVLSMNSSINFYMFVGGTHFDFWNGASNISKRYGPIVTSYDYDAPISESGDIGEKYKMLRTLFTQFKLTPKGLPPIPQNAPKEAYSSIAISEYFEFDKLLEMVAKPYQIYKYPRNMENIYVNNGNGQGYGWILYRTRMKKPTAPVSLTGMIHDRAQVFFNEQNVGIHEFQPNPIKINLPIKSSKAQNNIFDVLVENMGRVNWDKPINIQRKGLLGNVTVNGAPLDSWSHIPFEFTDAFKANLSSSKSWKPMKDFKKQVRPMVYRGYLYIKKEPKDTFLNMEKWERGIVMINKFIVGRYWNVGPQRTLYIPAPLLKKGKNEVMVFELHKASAGNQLIFTDKPLLMLESQKAKLTKN